MAKKHSGLQNSGFLFLGVCLLSFLFLPLRASAVESAAPVRVGWYQSDQFQEGASDDAAKSGYCYDYLQKVADYTSWQYEYVYGEWNELFQMLQEGRIDFMAGVFLTEDRKETMLFPNSPMGTDQYYLCKRANDDSISSADVSTISGKRIGGVPGDRVTALTEQWLRQEHLDLEMVYFDTLAQQQAAFESGNVDLLIQSVNSIVRVEGISIVTKAFEDPFYLAVSKSRPDLLVQMNDSLNTILSIDPFILQNMQYANYGATLTSKTITKAETEWISAHNTLTVGYLDDYSPYSDTDGNGQATGLMTDVLDAILDALELEARLSVIYQPYSSYDEMNTALREGRIDVAFPVYGNPWYLEQDQINATSAVITCSEAFFYKGTFQKENVQSIAVNENNRMQIAYCIQNFPDAKLVVYPTIEDCLTAVLEENVDGTVVNNLRSELVTGNSKYKTLSYVQLENDDSRCFGLNEDDTALLLLMNRGLRIIGASYGIDHSYPYIEGFYSYSITDFIMDNILWIGLVMIGVVYCIIALLIVSLRKKERYVQEQEEYIQQVKAFNTVLEDLRHKADAANAAKTTFLFNMSHDIRTPMNAILGFTGLMEKELDQPQKLKEHLAKVQTSGEFLLTLINNMLEVARIDSGKESIDVSFANLIDGSLSVVPLVENEIRRKHLVFSRQLNVQHPYVFADVKKIREINMNLLSNAIKYTPDGGSVSMQLEEIPCSQPGFATYVHTITDTGIGMSEEFQKQIFDSFSREHNTTESRVAGTGLGMAIVKKLVDLMGGTIELHSELGKGTQVIVTMTHQIVDEPAKYLEQQHQARTVQKLDLTGRRILLAEDNDLNAEIAQAILEDLGAQVEWAHDGVECVEMLLDSDDGYYDLILMDIQMPNLNGYDATRKIRKLPDPDKANIPILAMTANAFEEDRRNALQCGMNDHIAKPIEIPKLMQALATFLK